MFTKYHKIIYVTEKGKSEKCTFQINNLSAEYRYVLKTFQKLLWQGYLKFRWLTWQAGDSIKGPAVN